MLCLYGEEFIGLLVAELRNIASKHETDALIGKLYIQTVKLYPHPTPRYNFNLFDIFCMSI